MANEVEITVTAKDRTSGGFDSAGGAADKYGRKLGDLGERADRSEQRILGVKDTVDGVATIMKGPGEQGIAAYIQGWADLASGLANFVIPAVAASGKAIFVTAVSTVKSTAATVAKRTAEVAGAVATRAVTIAQWALNAALRANPIGIVITVITLLVIAIIRWYNTSQRARDIINGVFRSVVAGGRALWDGLRTSWSAIQRLWSTVSSFISRAARSGFLGPIPLIISRWREVVSWFRALPGRIVGAIGNVKDLLYNKGRDVLRGFWNGLKSIWDDVTKWIRGLTGWIKDHKGPLSFDSKLLEPAGKAIMEGFHRGLKNGGLKAMGFVKSIAGQIAGGFSSGGAVGPVVDLGRNMAAQMGWTGNQWNALYQLWQHESGWNPSAQNPTSTAYGIAQFLNSTWAGTGFSKSSNPQIQIAAGLNYIRSAYGSPMNAWNAWLSRSPHWYGSGLEAGVFNRPTLIGVGERGPEEVSITPVGKRRGGNVVVLQIDSSGSRLDDLLVDVLRKSIRIKGGDVQTVLGT